MTSWTGRTLNDIQIQKLIGRDAVAETYAGQSLSTEQPVQVKVIYAASSQSPDTLDLLKAEAARLTELNHPNIHGILNFDIADGQPFFVHELLDGIPLSEYLKDLSRRGVLLPLHVVARLLRPIASAIDFAHARGVIHRDISPASIILRRGTSPTFSAIPLLHDFHPVVTNFSIAHILNTPQGSPEDFITGSPAYMSPEQATGGNIDKRSDIYSLGALLYELLIGVPPVLRSDSHSDTADRKREIHVAPLPFAAISPSVAKVVYRAMAKDPAKRYQRAIDLVDDFDEAIRLEPTLSMPTRNWTVSPSHPTVQMKRPPKPRRSILVPILTLLVALVVLAALCALGYVGWRYISTLGQSFAPFHSITTTSIFTLNLMGIQHDQIQDRRS